MVLVAIPLAATGMSLNQDIRTQAQARQGPNGCETQPTSYASLQVNGDQVQILITGRGRPNAYAALVDAIKQTTGRQLAVELDTLARPTPAVGPTPGTGVLVPAEALHVVNLSWVVVNAGCCHLLASEPTPLGPTRERPKDPHLRRDTVRALDRRRSPRTILRLLAAPANTMGHRACDDSSYTRAGDVNR